jgi:hypothetical protein
MNAPKSALLLVGSPRAPKSNSEALGRYLLDRLADRGLATRTVRLRSAMKTEAKRAELREALAGADLVLLTAPLYVDSVPSFVIEALEWIAAQGPFSAGFMAMVNCGFPEAHQNEVALENYRLFAREAGLTWLGGLPVGMGEMLGEKPIKKSGGPLTRLCRALDLTAEALAAGQPVPSPALTLVQKPPLPAWLYLFMGNRSWRSLAKRAGISAHLHDRPYED